MPRGLKTLLPKQTDTQAVKATVEANAKAVADVLKESKTASAATKGLADKAETVEQRIKDYEAKLEGLADQCDEQLEEIKHLLPGATAAGLASAFDARRETFMEPSKRWQVVFVTSVIILAIGAFVSLLEVYQHASTMACHARESRICTGEATGRGLRI